MPSIAGLLTFAACALAGLLAALGLVRLVPDFVPGPLPLLAAAIAMLLWSLRERRARFSERHLLLAEIDHLAVTGTPARRVEAVSPPRTEPTAPVAVARQEPRLAVPVVQPDAEDEAEVAAQVEQDAALFAAVREALNHNRMELHAQPIVQLPARRLRYVELFARARDSAGREMAAGSYLPALRAGGLAAEFDALMLMRGVQLVRLLENRTRNIGFFCNLSAEILHDAKAFAATLAFLRREREHTAGLILEFAAAGLSNLKADGWERLGQIAALGYPLSVDGFDHLQIDVAGLAKRGVRYLKLDSALLLDDARAQRAPVALADFTRLCARHDIEPILAKVECEADLSRLAALGFRLGQGHLFGEPTLARAA